jgi:hypothetical protein
VEGTVARGCGGLERDADIRVAFGFLTSINLDR